MSRCFPYPRPGHARNGVRDKALIESIKRETEIARKERREEKNRRKREKEKARGEDENSEKKHNRKRKHRDGRNKENDTRGDHHKEQRADVKHTEKSCLTEEGGQPVSSQNSSDSTFTSKGPQTAPMLPLEREQKFASTIRVQLPLQKQKDPKVTPIRKQPCPSAPERTEQSSVLGRMTMSNVSSAAPQSCGTVPQTSGNQTKPEQPYSTSVKARDCSSLKLSKEKDSCLSCEAVAETSVKRALTNSSTNLHSARPSSSEVKYAKLVENWVPPCLLNWSEEDLGDQEWHFQRQQEDRQGVRDQRKVENAVLAFTHGGSLGPWPQVCFLPEVEIHALPYTIPY